MDAFMNTYAITMLLIIPGVIITPLIFNVWEYFSNRAADKRWQQRWEKRINK